MNKTRKQQQGCSPPHLFFSLSFVSLLEHSNRDVVLFEALLLGRGKLDRAEMRGSGESSLSAGARGKVSDPVRLWWQSLEWGFTRRDGNVPKVFARLPLGDCSCPLDHEDVHQQNVALKRLLHDFIKEALGLLWWMSELGFIGPPQQALAPKLPF